MAARSYLAGSGDQVGYTPSVDVAAGFIVVVGSFVGFATSPLPANQLGNVKCGGCDWFSKDPALAMAVGDVVYLEVAQTYQRVNKTSASNLRLGVVAKAAASTDTEVLVLWNRVTT